MLAFVLSLLFFIFFTWRNSGYISQECKGAKEKVPRKLNSRVTTIMGMLTLIMLTISILLDVSVTGMLWWTSYQLNEKYQVMGNCFCEVSTSVHHYVGNNLNVECPHVAGFSCTAVIDSVLVPIGSLTFYTNECQSLSGGPQDSTCMEYFLFWSMFKALRILLPILALVKLPVLLGNCNRSVCKDKKEKFVTDSISWIGLQVAISPLKMVDPVQFYSDICTPLDTRPPFSERLGPVGQEHDGDGSIPGKHSHGGANAVAFSSVKKTKLATISSPTPPYGDIREEALSIHKEEKFQDESPPDTSKHTFSTPKNPKMSTPSFDLSKVVKPNILDISDSEVPDRRLNFKAAGNRVSRLSSFSSSHDVMVPPPPPPLPKPYQEVFQSPSRHPPPPFSRTVTSLPKRVRINSDLAPLSPPPTPTIQDDHEPESLPSDSSLPSIAILRLQPQNKKPVRELQACSNPLQICQSSIREISQKAKDRSNNIVDWTKLP